MGQPAAGQAPGIVGGRNWDSLHDSVGAKTERRGQLRQPWLGHRAQRHQHRIAAQPPAAGGELGAAAGQLLRQQADHHSQHVLHQAHAAAHPAHGAGQLHPVAANLVGRLHQARRLLGVHDDLLKPPQRPRQPRRQAVGQQAEGRVALPAVPARDLRAGRPPALIGAVPRERASAVWVIRAPVEPCRTPRFLANVLPAGEPRLIPKLHRPRPGGSPPARASFSLRVDPPRIPAPRR